MNSQDLSVATPPRHVVEASGSRPASLAVMQPYFFPYLGYFHLIAAVDRFVIYDDVAFIKRGWIHRNRILLNGEPYRFSIPLHEASQFTPISEVPLSASEYPRWKEKFLKTLEHAYRQAPFYASTRSLVAEVLDTPGNTIRDLAVASILAVTRLLQLPTSIVESSRVYENAELRAAERLIDICLREGATLYVNSPGGRELYTADTFRARGIELRFLESRLPEYPQLGNPFVPGLSIIDLLMFNPPEALQDMVRQFQLAE